MLAWLARIGSRLSVWLPWIAVILAIPGAYAIWHENRPHVSFEVTSESDVVDVRRPLEDLVVLFQGQDLQDGNLNLRIYTMCVVNDGEEDIAQGDYDRNLPWGFKVEGGKVIGVKLTDSSDDYLVREVKPRIYGEEVVEFNKTILNRGAFFMVEFSVLHNRETEPHVVPVGKIAGIDPIVPVKIWMDKQQETLLARAFRGNPWVHLIRGSAYVFAAIVLLALFFTVLYWRGTIASRLYRRRIESVLGAVNLPEGRAKQQVLALYAWRGVGGLEAVRSLLKDRPRLTREAQRHREREKKSEEDSIGVRFRFGGDEGGTPEVNMLVSEAEDWEVGPAKYLTAESLAGIGEDGQLEVDIQFERALNDLIEQLRGPEQPAGDREERE